jgi:hypothetical protein
MKSKSMIKRFLLLLIFCGVAVVLMGCAGSASRKEDSQSADTEEAPFVYHSDNEIPEGPGLLTGEDGVWTIYRSDKLPWDSQQDQQPSQPKDKDMEQKKDAE